MSPMLPAPGIWASTETPRQEGQLWGNFSHQIELWGDNTGDICNSRKPETGSEQEAKLWGDPCKWSLLETAISEGEGVKLQCGRGEGDTGGKLQQE